MNKKAFAYVAILAAAGLAACGDPKAANEKNFNAALSNALSQNHNLCLGLDIKGWPARVDVRRDAGRQFAALERAGLVTLGQKVSTPDYTTDVALYGLTDKGQDFYRESELPGNIWEPMKTVKRGDFCYGKLTIGSIVKWKGPKGDGDYKEAVVTYTYAVEDAPSWTQSPDIKTAFPIVERMLEGAKKLELQDTVKLTSLGWEAGPLSLQSAMALVGVLK